MGFDFDQKQIEILMLVFCRIFGLFFFFPGALFIPVRVRVLLSVASALAVHTSVELRVIDFNLQLLLETFIGSFIGLLVSIIFSAVNVSGTLIVYQSGLMYSALSDISDEMGVNVSKLLGIVVILLLTYAKVHILALYLVIESYKYLQFDSLFLSDDFVKAVISVSSSSFLLAFKIASPILVLGSVMYFCFALINKLIPSVQAFFVFSPLQIWVNLLMLVFAISEMSMHLADSILHQINALLDIGSSIY